MISIRQSDPRFQVMLRHWCYGHAEDVLDTRTREMLRFAFEAGLREHQRQLRERQRQKRKPAPVAEGAE